MLDTPARQLHRLGPHSPYLPLAIGLDLEIRPAVEMIEPSAVIVSAEMELGYNYVGLEERIADGGVDWARALSVVESQCAPCSQANTICFVQAVEAMGHLIVPPRAAYLRLLLAELERVISHLQNAALTMGALGLHDREAALLDLRERTVHALADWSGARVQPGLITYGGLTRNMDEPAGRALALAVRGVERALRAHVVSIINSKAIADRLTGLGVISGPEAVASGVRGPVARACGLASDIRATFPTGAYDDEAATIIVQRHGDAYSRLVVRLLECLESFRVIEQALDDLPGGPIRARGMADLRAGKGISRVEGPRGEVFCWVDGTPEGLRGLHISTGSFPTLGIVTGLLRGVRLDDLRLLLLSLDLCLACAER